MRPYSISPRCVSSPMHVTWPSKQRVNVGNLLIFRKELELLAQLHGKNQIKLFFVGSKQQEFPFYFYELILSNTIDIQCCSSNTAPRKCVWPSKDMAKWQYGSFKRVAVLCKQVGQFPSLSWPSDVLKNAHKLLDACRRLRDTKIIALHMKNQPGGVEESNASMDHWYSFLVQAPTITFVLLSNDPIDRKILGLPNVIHLDQEVHPLSVQLALCALCDGFMGMASGIATAAILSEKPYVIFKHPSHHTVEVQEELGSNDHFEFSLPRQKILRQTDIQPHLMAALEMLS